MSDFNPRPPRGERPEVEDQSVLILVFQSTPSARRATKDDGLYVPTPEISIHALREESDAIKSLGVDGNTVFQSTPSARRATVDLDFVGRNSGISIHALREESDSL